MSIESPRIPRLEVGCVHKGKQKGAIIRLRVVSQNEVVAYNLSDGTKTRNDTLQEFNIDNPKDWQAYGPELPDTQILTFHRSMAHIAPQQNHSLSLDDHSILSSTNEG